jgi:hypothetical protein
MPPIVARIWPTGRIRPAGGVCGERAPVACIAHQLAASPKHILPNNWGYMYAYMYASYRTNDGEYWHTWAKAIVHENANVNAPHGTLHAELWTGCTGGAVLRYSSLIPVRGGGASGVSCRAGGLIALVTAAAPTCVTDSLAPSR